MRKIKNTKNTTIDSTLLPRLTSLSHKKPAKNTRFSPTESLQAPACRPPAARLFSRSLSEHIFRKQAPAREIPPPTRCPPVLNWELEVFQKLHRRPPAIPITPPVARPLHLYIWVHPRIIPATACHSLSRLPCPPARFCPYFAHLWRSDSIGYMDRRR